MVGCGALGNEVLKNLALMGAERLVIVDFDYVEEVNLGRSVLFRREDIGRPKVDAARDGIRRLNPDVEVIAVNGDIAYDVGIGLLREADAVIGCVDSRWARYCINRLAFRAGRKWVDGGIFGLTGTARVFSLGKSCYACSLSTDEMNELKRRMPCSGVIRRTLESGHAPTTSIVASVIGAIEAQEAMKIALSRCSNIEETATTALEGRMAVYEGEAMDMKVVRFEAYDEDCPCHEEWVPVVKTDISVDMTVGEVLKRFSSFELRDDCFVDYIVSRRDDAKYEVMLAGRFVADFVQNDRVLGQLPLGEYYQNEYRKVDGMFPYPELTLKMLGVTTRDVLRAYICRDDDDGVCSVTETFIELR